MNRITLRSLRMLFPGAALCICAAGLQAVSFYWGDTPVKSGSVKTCLSFAGTVARAQQLQNLRISANEVAGTQNGNYVAITCIGTSPRATAMVMVAGETAGPAIALRDALKAKIAAITLID